jgi:hypothetical protein
MEVFLLHNDKKQKGDKKTNILINIYLTPYVIIKFKKPIEIIECNKPSKEKILIDEESEYVKTEFNFIIKEEKHISELNNEAPNSLIPEEIMETKKIISLQINKEQFIKIEQSNNLNKKERGLSTSVIPK